MREPLFVKQNSDKWKSFESVITNDPDELADRFIQITDDLAYAKTFYPNSKTTTYLNGLATKLHQSIYKNKTEKGNRFILYWTDELPRLFYTYRRQLLYSFIFFMVFCLMGALSAKYDQNFLRIILGDEYVDKTEAYIARGNPFGVYKENGELISFLTIGGHNIYVSFITFVCGILGSIGTVFFLFQNGLMVGAFEGFLFAKGYGPASILVIWIHGVLEISSIVIAGGAGLVLGNSLLFPKTYKRMESLKRGARDGTKITIGLVPIFIVAAFFEGFVTRHTEMPVWCSVSILAASLAFIIWYVIIYPYKLTNKITE